MKKRLLCAALLLLGMIVLPQGPLPAAGYAAGEGILADGCAADSAAMGSAAANIKENTARTQAANVNEITTGAANVRPAATAAATGQTYVLTYEEAEETAAAGELFARIFTEGAGLYADAAMTDMLFQPSLSYYVKVLALSPETCRVAYCYEDYDYARSVAGYMATAELTLVSSPPTGRSFPNVFCEFEGNGTFYKNSRFDSFYPSGDTLSSSDAFFYGYYPRGSERYCYVLRGGRLGYYSADVFREIEVPLHPDPPPAVRTPAAEVPAAPERPSFFDSDVNKTIFIAVACIVAVAAVYLIFLPRKKEPLPEEDDGE